MKKVKVLKDHAGMKAGDVVAIEHDPEADAHVEAGIVEHFDPKKHGEPDELGKHDPNFTPAAEAATDVGAQ